MEDDGIPGDVNIVDDADVPGSDVLSDVFGIGRVSALADDIIIDDVGVPVVLTIVKGAAVVPECVVIDVCVPGVCTIVHVNADLTECVFMYDNGVAVFLNIVHGTTVLTEAVAIEGVNVPVVRIDTHVVAALPEDVVVGVLVDGITIGADTIAGLSLVICGAIVFLVTLAAVDISVH